MSFAIYFYVQVNTCRTLISVNINSAACSVSWHLDMRFGSDAPGSAEVEGIMEENIKICLLFYQSKHVLRRPCISSTAEVRDSKNKSCSESTILARRPRIVPTFACVHGCSQAELLLVCAVEEPWLWTLHIMNEFAAPAEQTRLDSFQNASNRCHVESQPRRLEGREEEMEGDEEALPRWAFLLPTTKNA